MRVLITGATGMIGQEVVELCHNAGMEVFYLTTSKNKIENQSNYKGFYWNPYKDHIDLACFSGVEVIINLVGATVAKRWTEAHKKAIVDSRTITTALIRNSLAKIDHTVRQIISASAIGIYEDSFQNYYTEESNELGNDFLAKVVKLWEAEVKAFQEIDIDPCMLRIGLVLSNKGGAYPKIAKPIKYKVGAAFGSGKQWQSWIHLEDLSRMFLYALQEELEGIYNAVAPNPVSNNKLTQVIADQLDQKIFLPNVPRFAMRLILGEMHTILYSSQRVSCKKIIETGFQFNYDNIVPAISDLVD